MNDTVENPFGAVVPAQADSPSAVALAQREVAEVQSGMMIAKRFPRNQQESMDKIITSCTRTSLAEQAVYQYARGGTDVTGPSIRLAEELARSWGNIAAGVAELSRGDGTSECMAYAWDLESGYRDEKRFQVRHWRDTRQGGYKITDERDIYEHTANQAARRKRACILAVIPGDVVEAAVRQCELTLSTSIEVTPARIEDMIGKFATFGVTKEMIEKRVQRRVASITPALFLNLGKIYNSLKDGMSKPADWFDVQEQKNGTTLAEMTGEEPANEPPASMSTEPECGGDQPEVAFTPEEVQKLIDDAKNSDQLDEAMDLISEIAQSEERQELKRSAIKKYGDFIG